MPRALVCGVGGQDGAYLAKSLHMKGYELVGTSRDVTAMRLYGLQMVGMIGSINLVSMAPNDFRSVLQTVSRYMPDEIYNLAGQSSVGMSFEQPVETIESVALGTLNLLEAIRFCGRKIRLYNAGSSECFGDTKGIPANEDTPFRPRSPYAVAKACAHNLVANYRDSYDIFACSGILFNHESPLRPERFVTQKIVAAARRISTGESKVLNLGNLDIYRDWGWAPEYVEAMWLMLQTPNPTDIVIATGHTHSLRDFVQFAFNHFALDWREYVIEDESLLRPSDIKYGAADPTLAKTLLGWKAQTDMQQIVTKMCAAIV